MNMKTHVGLLAVALSLVTTAPVHAAGQSDALRLSEPVERSADSETFGAPLDESVPAVTITQILDGGERYVGERVRVSAEVSRVCQKKGCFLIAREGPAFLRVSFRDYGFFVPTDIGGRRVTLVGEVVVEDVTPARVEHYAEDLGERSTVLEPGRRYEIVATSVRVPRS